MTDAEHFAKPLKEDAFDERLGNAGCEVDRRGARAMVGQVVSQPGPEYREEPDIPVERTIEIPVNQLNVVPSYQTRQLVEGHEIECL